MDNRTNYTEWKEYKGTWYIRRLDADSILTFGKYKGKSVLEVPIEYLMWIRDKTKIGIDFHDIVTHLVDNKLPIVTMDSYYEGTPEEWYYEEIKAIQRRVNVNFSQAKFILEVKLTKINKVGNPTVDDWDDYKYTPPKTYYGEVF